MEHAEMKRLPEAVTTKFTELFAALHSATDDLKISAAEACLIGDFSQVTVINDSCRKLQVLESDIKATMNHFDAKDKMRTLQKTDFTQKSKCRTLKTHGLFRIKVGDKVIEETTIVEAFVKALKVFGLDRVARLNKILTAVPLIARTPVNGYQRQRRCDGWFIVTHVNKHSAAAVLEEIGKDLNMPVKFEFIEERFSM